MIGGWWMHVSCRPIIKKIIRQKYWFQDCSPFFVLTKLSKHLEKDSEDNFCLAFSLVCNLLDLFKVLAPPHLGTEQQQQQNQFWVFSKSWLCFISDSPKPPTGDRFLLSDEYGSQARLKRSPVKNQKGGSLNVETLVVADRKMLEKHSKENVTTYILTVMNMVRQDFDK